MQTTRNSRLKVALISLTTQLTHCHSPHYVFNGYRSDNRYLVFQALPHTIGLAAAQWRVLAKTHDKRNLAEYEGHFDADPQLLKDLLAAAEMVNARLALLMQPANK